MNIEQENQLDAWIRDLALDRHLRATNFDCGPLSL